VQAHLQEASVSPAVATLSGGDGRRIRIEDVTSHGLGVLAHNEADIQRNVIVIARNSRVPAKSTRVFQTKYDRQEAIDVNVTQGDETDPEYVKVFKTEELPLPHRHPAGAPMEFTFSYDADGLLHVGITNVTTGDFIGELEVRRPENLDEPEVAEFRSALLATEVN
jgi:molecular chaperone DnaK